MRARLLRISSSPNGGADEVRSGARGHLRSQIEVEDFVSVKCELGTSSDLQGHGLYESHGLNEARGLTVYGAVSL